MTEYEALMVVLTSNLVLISALTIVVMLVKQRKK